MGNGAFGPKGGALDGIAVFGNRVIVNTLLTSKLFSVPIQADGKPGDAPDAGCEAETVSRHGGRGRQAISASRRWATH